MNLLYLNVLIAMMSKSFERVEEAASGMSRLALASSLVTWEAILPSAVRKRKHEALIPPKGSKKKIVKMTLYEGLGWLNFLPYFKAQGKQVTIDDGMCTVFAKTDKNDWHQMDIDERERVEAQRLEERQKMMNSVHDMEEMLKESMKEMKTMLERGGGGAGGAEEGGGEGVEGEEGDGAERLSIALEQQAKRKRGKRDRLKSIFGRKV